MYKSVFRKNLNNFPLLILLFLFMSIPIGVFGLLNLENFDVRNRAAQLKEDYKCVISFPYVNPSTIPVNSIVQVQVLANIPNENAKILSIIDKNGTSIFKKTYTENVSAIQEIFTFTATDTGIYSILGILESDVKSYPCVLYNSKTIAVVEGNSPPNFTTVPAQSKPSNAIRVNDSYEYTLNVEDIDNDTINYSFSFTPNTTWLKRAVIDNGSNGKLTLRLTGKPDKPGSYLANIFVHDGYQNHLKAQSWVISVDQDKNDVPKITILNPKNEINVTNGEKITIDWKVEDLNLITKQDIYITNNVKNEEKWKKLESLTNKYGKYVLDTSSLEPGKYNIIITATDNFSPSATGKGITPIINVEESNNKSDDGVIISDPQIVNISPSNELTIKNLRPNITATLIAGTKANILKDTIKVFLDEKDITGDIKSNNLSDSEITVIYTPTQDMTLGSHKVKVEFSDSNNDRAEKEWTFTIIKEDINYDKINILGLEIDRKLFYIIIGGIALLILAIIIPWLLYLAWKGSNQDDDYEINTVYTQTPPSYIPMYEEPINNTNTEEKPLNTQNNTYILPTTEPENTSTTPKEREKIEKQNETEGYFENKTQQYPFTTDSTQLPEYKQTSEITNNETKKKEETITQPIVHSTDVTDTIDTNLNSILNTTDEKVVSEDNYKPELTPITPRDTFNEETHKIDNNVNSSLPPVIDVSEEKKQENNDDDNQYQELLALAEDFEIRQEENNKNDDDTQFNTSKPK